MQFPDHIEEISHIVKQVWDSLGNFKCNKEDEEEIIEWWTFKQDDGRYIVESISYKPQGRGLKYIMTGV